MQSNNRDHHSSATVKGPGAPFTEPADARPVPVALAVTQPGAMDSPASCNPPCHHLNNSHTCLRNSAARRSHDISNELTSPLNNHHHRHGFTPDITKIKQQFNSIKYGPGTQHKLHDLNSRLTMDPWELKAKWPHIRQCPWSWLDCPSSDGCPLWPRVTHIITTTILRRRQRGSSIRIWPPPALQHQCDIMFLVPTSTLLVLHHELAAGPHFIIINL